MTPKDDRLYAKFDIHMDENAKIIALSDAAFRALIESTMYARRQRSDGRLDARVVERKWPNAASELTTNHPERPSWVPVEGGYEIRDYGAHQTTNADIERKKEAGRLGGLAKASTRLAKKELETELTTTDVVVEPRKRGTRIPDQFIVNTNMRQWAATHAPAVDVDRSTMKFANHFRAKTGRDATKLDWVLTWQNWLLNDADRSKPTPEARARATVTLATELVKEVEA